MKKIIAMLCAAMLCACCLGLAACGGSGSSSAASSASGSASASASSESASASASSASASASASASSAAAQATFAGNWKLAAVVTQGITMAGDLGAIMGEDQGMALVLKDDGTGTFSFGDESSDITWKQKDASTITMTVTSDEGNTTDTDITMKDGALFANFSDESFSGEVIFTTDGTYAAAKVITADGATPITSEDALVGTWKLTGMNMMGVSMYGDGDDLAAMAGSSDMSLTFEKGGTCKIMGTDTTYTVGADGATISDSGVTMPIKAQGNDIIIDMSEVLGMPLIMLFSK